MPRYPAAHSFRVRFPARPATGYAVRVGEGLLASLPSELARRLPAHRYFLITDRNVARLHGRRLAAALRRAGHRVDLLVVPAGERAKTRETKARLEDRMLALGGGRDAAVVALGGGMIGDLAGFVAATFQRGLPLLSLPTTLLAMVDAAIGGKTAVDHPRGKNLIGAFHQPREVVSDLAVLATLPEREFRSGLAEAVKAAVVGDAALFARLERSAAAILARHPEALGRLVAACGRIKARVVESDERETGRRAGLNFGHTLGHALEHLSRYRFRHGEAVAIGMAVESRAAEAAGILRRGDAARIAALLDRLGLPTDPPAGIPADRLLLAARTDKKVRRGRLRYALPRRIGSMAGRGGRTTLALPDPLVVRAIRRA